MSVFKTKPAVFAVEDTYQIAVPVTEPTVMWVKVGDKCYFDHSNGILRSRVSLHKMSVPMKEMDNAGQYTVCYRKMIERKPYFSETSEVFEQTFKFRAVKGEKINAYHISDAHNMVEPVVLSAKAFIKNHGELDFLILNGDVPDDSGKTENFDNIYEIISRITGGEIPTVFSRGNHDMRGIFAENLADYTPTHNGNSYFTFNLGDIWGMVLDCGEDKEDHCDEYGNTVCCHTFRLEETEFIKRVAEKGEYKNKKHKLIVCHNPFTRVYEPPFNVDEDIYKEWSKIIRENIHPDVMICGHKHSFSFDEVGGKNDNLGQPCTVIVGAGPCKAQNYFAGAGFIFEENKITAVFNDSDRERETHVIQN